MPSEQMYMMHGAHYDRCILVNSNKYINNTKFSLDLILLKSVLLPVGISWNKRQKLIFQRQLMLHHFGQPC